MFKKIVLMVAVFILAHSYADDMCPDCRKPFAQNSPKEQGPIMLPCNGMLITVDASFNEYLLKTQKLDTAYRAVFNSNFIFEYVRGDYDFNQLLTNLAKVYRDYIFKVAPQDFFVRGTLPTTMVTKKNLIQGWPGFRLSYTKNALIMDEADSLLSDREAVQNFFDAQQSALVILYRGHLLATCKCINWIGVVMQKNGDRIIAYTVDSHIKKTDANFYTRIMEKILKLLATAF
jgi:hypothetical protein